jgi:hypothetical protein
MIALGVIAGYLFIGLVLGRIAFVKTLGDTGRFSRYSDGDIKLDHDGDPVKSGTYVDALSVGWLFFLIWPLVIAGMGIAGTVWLPYKFLTRETKHERQARSAEAREKAEKETKQLEREVLSHDKNATGHIIYRGESK